MNSDQIKAEPNAHPAAAADATQPAEAPGGDVERAASEIEIRQPAETDLQALAAELEQSRALVVEYEDQCLRTRAEAENTRRRANTEIANARKFANENFARELLTVKDSLDLARNVDLQEAGDGVVEKMLEGLELTSRQFEATFERFGVAEITPETGEKFDPERHQAMTMQESADVAPNHVLIVVQKGYMLHERLLRPAMVVVAKAPTAETEAVGG
jgi:molecular chaperone GrpE